MSGERSAVDRALGCFWMSVALGLLCLAFAVALEAFTLPPQGFAP